MYFHYKLNDHTHKECPTLKYIHKEFKFLVKNVKSGLPKSPKESSDVSNSFIDNGKKNLAKNTIDNNVVDNTDRSMKFDSRN